MSPMMIFLQLKFAKNRYVVPIMDIYKNGQILINANVY